VSDTITIENIAHVPADLDELPVGTKVIDSEGDTGTHLGNGVWSVTGIGETVWSSFFRFPVYVGQEELPQGETITTIRQLDALPSGSIVVGLDPLRTVRVKLGSDWYDPARADHTWNVDTYVHARRYGFAVAFRPTY
jgi:hypothetical protein